MIYEIIFLSLFIYVLILVIINFCKNKKGTSGDHLTFFLNIIMGKSLVVPETIKKKLLEKSENVLSQR